MIQVREHTCVIGVPAFNEERVIVRALESLWRQRDHPTYRFHLVVVANGCTDRTVDVALAFAQSRCGKVASVVSGVEGSRWLFQADGRAVTVCNLPRPSKVAALQLIHDLGTDVVVVLDADSWFEQDDAIIGICRSLEQHPDAAAVAPRVVGDIVALQRSQPLLNEHLRRLVCGAVNAFDLVTPRLDGRVYAYRLASITRRLPDLVAVDLWLEWTFWKEGGGCVYLPSPVVHYVFPKTWGQLVRQYVRYKSSIADLEREYPAVMAEIACARRPFIRPGGARFWLHRAIGWLFFRWLARQAPSTGVDGGGPWEVITSTKE